MEGELRELVRAEKTGYILVIDDNVLMSAAREHDLVLRLLYQSGDFTHKGRTLIEVWPPENCDDDAIEHLRGAFSIGAKRTALQDLRFLVDELVEIAARALSPGVNDPFTAITCLDWLGAALSDLSARDLPSHLRVDEDGALRVITHSQTFEQFLERAFGALSQYCASDAVAALRFLRALGEVAADCDDAGRLASLSEMAKGFEALVKGSLIGPNLAQVEDRIGQLQRALKEPDYKRRLRDSAAWLGGTA